MAATDADDAGDRTARDPTDDDADEPGAARRVGTWVLIVECLLALSWTLYVLFLPKMLADAGIERRWFVYVLLTDQLIFAACDWIAGVYADRVARGWRRLGRLITATTLLSSAALLAMPWIATGGNAPLLLAIIFVWAATSSALRAPVFALLGRVREARGPSSTGNPRAGIVGLALVGISLASAVGPYVTLLLKGVDARLPIALSAATLATAGLWAVRADAMLPPRTTAPTTDDAGWRRRAWSLAGIVLLASFGTQIVTAIVAQPLMQRFVGTDALVWTSWFWIGFAFGLVPGHWIAAARGDALIHAAVALLVGAAAFAVGAAGGSLPIVVAGLAVSGAAWGVFSTIAFTIAVSLSAGHATARGAGTASGLLFSALAVGALLRFGLVVTGFSRAAPVLWLPTIAWVVAAVALIVVARTIWRRRAAA